MKQHLHNAKLLLVLALIGYALFSAFFTYSWSPGPNYRNVSVDTTVNITNAIPTVLSVIIINGASVGVQNITLNAGSFVNVTCNTTVRDYNGGSTINNITATFFANTTPSNSSSLDDNNTHYSDLNCTLGNFDATTRNATCSFLVQYYSNADRWICNVTATDDFIFSNASRQQSGQNFTHIDALLALNVTPLIDYGNMAVGDVSVPQDGNITNFGNQNINISVYGYGHNVSEGLAMYCDVGNISVREEKFNLIGGVNVGLYTNLSNVSQQIGGLTISQQTNDSQQVINRTYWLLYIPPNPFGRCNGTVVFQAEKST